MPQAPFLVASIALILNIPLSLGGELWLALHKGHMASFWSIVQTLLGLLFIILSALTHAHVTLMVVAIYGAMLLGNAGSLTHVLYLHHHLRPLRYLPPQAIRTVLVQGGLLFAVIIAGSCATAFDNVMALAWLGPAASAQMAVAMRVCITAASMVGAVTYPFWPSFAEALVEQDKFRARRMLSMGTAAVLVLSIGGSGLIVAFGAPVLRWWLHQNLNLPPSLLWGMAAWIVATTLTNVTGALLNAASWLKPQMLILGMVAAGGFLLKFVAARIFGVAGILSVTPTLWFCFVAPAYFWLAWRVVRQVD